MADTTRNIFSLSEYSDDTIAGEGISVDSVYVDDAYPNTGYFAGGTGGDTSVTKAVFDTDTLSNFTGMPWPGNTNNGSALVNGTHMYMAFGSTNSKVSRIEYATDNIATLPSGTPNPQMWQTSKGVFGTKSIGYVAGGQQLPGYSDKSIMYKMTYASETWNDMSGSLAMPSNYSRRVATSSATKGYITGGHPTNPWTLSMDYATETDRREFNAPGNDTTSAKGASGTSSETHGYFTGGDYNYTWSLSFYNDTILRLPASNYPLSEVSGQGAAGSITDGYHGGGSGGPSGVRSSIYKFNYSTGSWSNISAMPGNRENPYGGGARTMPASLSFPKKRWEDSAPITPNNGYAIAGGSPMVSFTDRLNMSTDSVERMPGMDSYNPAWMVGTTMASSTTKGYYGGEYAGGRSSIYNIVYATDGREHNPSLNLAEGLAYFNSAGNTNKGYVLGGYIAWPSPNRTLSRVSRMTYSTDSTSTIPGANIPATPTPNFATGEGTGAFSSSGDESGAAYLTGGKEWPSQGHRSYIWKMSYPTETTSLLPARVPNTRRSAAAHSEKSAGYLTGGWTGSAPTSVLKFPWSTETFVEDGGDAMHRVGASTGNQQAAYVMGGISNTTGSGTSAIKKFEYSTSTSSQISGGLTGPGNRQGAWGTGALTNNLPSVPDAPTATPTPSVSKQDQNWGIYSAQQYPSSEMFQKRDFSTDTVSALPDTGASAWSGEGLHNSRAVYIIPNGDQTGNLKKVDWSTQVLQTLPEKFEGPWNNEGTGELSMVNMNQENGWWTGGYGPGAWSPRATKRMRKLNFATETGYNPSRQQTEDNYGAMNSDSAVKGYMYGGERSNQNLDSKISYFNFASEGSWNNIPSAYLSTPRYQGAAVGNKTDAFIAGTGTGPGQPSSNSRFDKFTYATDTRDNVPSANLTPSYPQNTAGRGISAMGNQTHGYFGGSGPSSPVSTKLVYATETASATPNYNPKESNSNAWSQAQNSLNGKIDVPVSFQ